MTIDSIIGPIYEKLESELLDMIDHEENILEMDSKPHELLNAALKFLEISNMYFERACKAMS